MTLSMETIVIPPPTIAQREYINTWKISIEPTRPRLPKQWLHWAMKAGLKPTGSGRGLRTGFYLRGRGRNWRVTYNGNFEASCLLEDFDRWANSHSAYADSFPTNEKEFLETVKQLIAASFDTD